MPSSIPRKRRPVEVEDDSVSEPESQENIAPNNVDAHKPPQKSRKPSGVRSRLKPLAEPKRVVSKKPKKQNAGGAGYCSLSKKEFGDQIKETLALAKWGKQRTRINVGNSFPIEGLQSRRAFLC